MVRHVRRLVQFSIGAVGAVSGILYCQKVVKEKFDVFAAGSQNGISYTSFYHTKFDDYKGIMKLGYPDTGEVKFKKDYVYSYNRRTKIPNWACECLTANNDITVSKKDKVFYPDDAEDMFFQSEKADFDGSGYDRGHIICAGNHKKSLESYKETYIYTNVAPMYRKFNAGIWNELEKRSRNLTKEHEKVYVCSGPLFLPREEERFVKYDVIGVNNVAVPTHFFKVMAWNVGNEKFDLEAYVVPHEPSTSNKDVDKKLKLRQYYASRESINKAAGLILFPLVPDEKVRNLNENPANKTIENAIRDRTTQSDDTEPRPIRNRGF